MRRRIADTVAHHHLATGAIPAHGRSAEGYADRPHPEHVVLDIGDDLGALILHTDAAMRGVEVEISAAEHDEERTHKEVLERAINGRPAYTAVFDKIPQGTYTLWVNDTARARGVAIEGAAIAELDWRASDVCLTRPTSASGPARPSRPSTSPRSESG